MDNMFVLGIMVVGAFLIQSALGFFQIKHFGNEYNELKAEGRVAIGKRAGKLTSGTIIMFLLDDEGVIVRGKKLQGTTILARFKPYDKFKGKYIGAITAEDSEMIAEIKITRNTVMNAVNNYKMFINGETIEEKESPVRELIKKIKNIKFG